MFKYISKANLLYTSILFTILTALSYYFYADHIAGFPSHIHAWTQSDKYALALGFLDNGFNIFLPRTYFYGIKDGITAVDLPLHEYIVALFMKISGSQAPVMIRGYTLLCQFVGYYFLYLLSCRLSGNKLLSLVVPIFAFTLPILTYYQICFLPSSTAWATFWISMYYLVVYHQEGKVKDFYWALGWLAVSALVRTPYNIYLMGVAIWLLGSPNLGKHRPEHSKMSIKAFLWAFGVIGAWAAYKYWLQRNYGTIFLSNLMPATSFAEWKQLMLRVWERWHTQFASVQHVTILAIAAIAAMLRGGKHKLLFMLALLFFCAGFVYFSGLMLKQFIDHEYYFIDSIYPALVLFFALGWSQVATPKANVNIALMAITAGMLVLASRHSKSIQEIKYAKTTWDRAEYVRTYMEGSDILLDQLGVAKDAKILVLDAYSVNMPLIKMKRYGWTMLTTAPKEVQLVLQKPFDYIVCIDAYFYSDVIADNPSLTSHLRRVGGNGRISVFQYLKEPQAPSDAVALLGIASPLAKDTLWVADTSTFSTSARWQTTIKPAQAPDSVRTSALHLPADQEFGVSYHFAVADVSAKPRNLLLEGEYCFSTSAQPLLCDLSIKVADTLFYYQSQPITTKLDAVWFHQKQMFVLPDNIPEGAQVNCYFWNPNKADVWIRQLVVGVY